MIELLNEVLTGELTAINQYFLHAKLCKHWGYMRLAGAIQKESIDEMKHAEALVDRILFLGGLPNLQRLHKVAIGETVEEIFANDVALEHQAIAVLKQGIAQGRKLGDHGTEDLLTRMLVSEENHLDWLTVQQELLQKLGTQHYLAQQMHAT